jgi:hypothetical protein
LDALLVYWFTYGRMIVWLKVGTTTCPPGTNSSAPGKERCDGALKIGQLTFYWYGGLMTIPTFVVG